MGHVRVFFRWLRSTKLSLREVFDGVVSGVCIAVGGFLVRLAYDRKARLIYGVVEIMVALILIGSMGASAWNFGATNFTQADATVRVMVGTVVPLMAGVGCLLLFIGYRRSRQ